MPPRWMMVLRDCGRGVGRGAGGAAAALRGACEQAGGARGAAAGRKHRRGTRVRGGPRLQHVGGVRGVVVGIGAVALLHAAQEPLGGGRRGERGWVGGVGGWGGWVGGWVGASQPRPPAWHNPGWATVCSAQPQPAVSPLPPLPLTPLRPPHLASVTGSMPKCDTRPSRSNR